MKHSNRTELFSAWIVVVALIAAMAIHTFLPRTPPRLESGVTVIGQHRVASPLALDPAEDFR
jgi:hypothetical protein